MVPCERARNRSTQSAQSSADDGYVERQRRCRKRGHVYNIADAKAANACLGEVVWSAPYTLPDIRPPSAPECPDN